MRNRQTRRLHAGRARDQLKNDGDGSRRLRVLHLVDRAAQGGAEQLLVHLANAGRGFDMSVATLRPTIDPTPIQVPLEDAGVDVTVFTMTGPGLQLRPRQFLRLLRFARRGGYDLLHTHVQSSHVVGLVAGRLLGLPVISTLHNVHEGRGRRWRDRVRVALLRHLATEIIAVGPTVARTWQPLLQGRRVEVVPNPAPPTSVAPQERLRRSLLGDADGPLLLAVGRLMPQKNHDLLLRTMARVLARHPDARLAIAGGGGLEDRLRRTATDLELDHAVAFLGQRDDVTQLMAAADIFVSPSAWEGMPLTVLEAMAAGTPVVATDVGDCRFALGDTGIIVPPGDVQALCDALTGLVGDPLAREHLGSAAQHRASEQFGTDRWVEQIEDIYSRASHRDRVIHRLYPSVDPRC